MSNQSLSKHELRQYVTSRMRTDFASVHPKATVRDALADLRHQALHSPIVYLYALDDEKKLVGVVPIRRMLLADEETRVGELMVTEVVGLTEHDTLLKASEKLMAHRFLALPVVDAEGTMRGVVDVQLFSHSVPEPHERDALDSMFQMIGVHARIGRRDKILASFGDRFPWLLANIASGTICALIVGMYEGAVAVLPLIAVFLTVVLALGESVSMQSMTLTLQNLAVGPMKLRRVVQTMGKELGTTFLLGLGSGVLVGVVAFLWKGSLLAGVAVGASIIGAMLVAAALGVLVPATIRALRADPHVASGPITLASADIFTVIIYLNVVVFLLLPS